MKSELLSLKSRLEELQSTFGEEEKIEEILVEQKEKSLEERVNQIINTKPEDLIIINVGGTIFSTRLETIMSVKDNLFHKMMISKKFDFSKEIFIDRSPELFPMIMDYFRYRRFDSKRLSVDQLVDFREEVIYYELLELENQLDKSGDTLEYVKVEVQKWYYDSAGLVGCMDPMSLLNRDLTQGICTDSPGMILLELNRVVDFDSIEIGSYTGRSDWVYGVGYGAEAKIETSIDNKNWTNVGRIPSGFGVTIMPAKLKRSSAKFIRFSGNSWIAIGFLKITNIY